MFLCDVFFVFFCGNITSNLQVSKTGVRYKNIKFYKIALRPLWELHINKLASTEMVEANSKSMLKMGFFTPTRWLRLALVRGRSRRCLQ